jgi:SOS regulatory protein LexA
MQLDAAQNRIIRSKPLSISLLKGISSSGKTTTAVYRSLFLKNNYCLYDDDRILILAKDSTDRDAVREMYNSIEDETKLDYQTLFSNTVDRVDIYTVEDIINRYYFEYTNTHKKWFKILQEKSEKIAIIDQCARELRRKYGYLKILDKNYSNFFMEEIEWIKACGYIDAAQYQNVNRTGRKSKPKEGPARLLKNSKERGILFELVDSYNKKLEESSLIDAEDIACLAIKQIKQSSGNKYSHILVDEGQTLSKIQIDFIKELSSNRTYSSTMFIINKSIHLSSKEWFIKGRKTNDFQLGAPIKSYSLSKAYHLAKEDLLNINMPNNIYKTIENFNYIDLRHRRRHEFKRDVNKMTELIVVDENKEQICSDSELAQLPVYSDIAAGEPILINSELESVFYIPEYWVKGVNNCFVLKVRGDSMIGADINDGDYVVIKKQSLAQNGDMVAVDIEGNATLKRLSLNKGAAVLMPENENYDPIFIHDKQVSIIGIAVGVIKNIQ